MKEMFNVDTQHFDFNVTAKLDKLVICFDNDLYKDLFNIEKEPGKTLYTLAVEQLFLKLSNRNIWKPDSAGSSQWCCWRGLH